jgi:phosphoribosylformylglycinamidine cyclo-ligase
VTQPDPRSAYQQAGVDIAAKMAIIDRIKTAAASTYTSPVLGGVGGFGGLFQIGPDSILVASTDGIGTKTMLAAQYGRFRGLGHDIVNHCINDILCQGAHPLFFMDYMAANRLEGHVVTEIVEGMAEACKAANCALLGGETAEMPGVYQPGQFDVAGTIIGLVNPTDRLPKPDIQPGNIIIGLESSGPHTNGYSLVRRVFADGLPHEWIDSALAPHRSYLSLVERLRSAVPIKALAHITGGGFFDNIPRVLPPNLGVIIRRGSWPVPQIFQEIARRGSISEHEMYHVFNMGIGLVMILSPDAAFKLQHAPRDIPADSPAWYQIGEVVEGTGVQLL